MDCDNWRGITLISVPVRVFASIVLSRLRRSARTYLRHEQAGFRPGRSCHDQIFVRTQTDHREGNGIANTGNENFIDFRKSLRLHTSTLIVVNSKAVWNSRQHCGHHSNLFNACTRAAKVVSSWMGWLAITRRLLQAFARAASLSPLLFAIYHNGLDMKKSLRNFEGGLGWTDGSSLCDLVWIMQMSRYGTIR